LENKFSISLWIKVNEHNHKTEQSLIDHRYEDYSSLTGFQLRLESTSSQISNQLDLVFIGIIDKSEQKFIVYNCIDVDIFYSRVLIIKAWKMDTYCTNIISKTKTFRPTTLYLYRWISETER